jgi:cobalamin transport system substrate-binding protein
VARTFFNPSFRREVRGHVLPGHLLLGLPLVLATAVAAGCASGAPPASDAAPATASLAASASTASAFPVTVVDDEGTTVSIAGEPQRIAALTPAATEMLFTIGAGDRVVATDSASDYPPDAASLPDVAEFGAVEIESIVDLEADLVIAGGAGYAPPDAISRLRDLEIPVVVLYAESVDAVAADVELVGNAVGEPDAARKLADSMRTEMGALSEAVAGGPKPRVFYEVDASRQIYGPAEDSFLAEMVALAGGDPITSGSAESFEISLESLVAADPEVIILGDAAFGASPQVVAQRPGWDGMTAVSSDAVRAVDGKLVTRPGPRLPQGLRSLILAIHPDVQLP